MTHIASVLSPADDRRTQESAAEDSFLGSIFSNCREKS